jgi:hypothetical protein
MTIEGVDGRCETHHRPDPAGAVIVARPDARLLLIAQASQRVISQPQPISCVRCSHGMPVFKTNRIQISTARSGIGLRSGRARLRGFGDCNRDRFGFPSASSKMVFAKPRTLPRTSYSYRSSGRRHIHSVLLGAPSGQPGCSVSSVLGELSRPGQPE